MKGKTYLSSGIMHMIRKMEETRGYPPAALQMNTETLCKVKDEFEYWSMTTFAEKMKQDLTLPMFAGIPIVVDPETPDGAVWALSRTCNYLHIDE